MIYSVASFYKFNPTPEGAVKDLGDLLKSKGTELDIYGLIVLAPEGINATIAGNRENVESYLSWMRDNTTFNISDPKWSESDKNPFGRLRIDLRPEIVTLGYETASQDVIERTKISPEEWHAKITSSNPPLMVDVRNDYEVRIGKFNGAIDPNTRVFTEFPRYLDSIDGRKDEEILMYCTGGIRCEKATKLMLDRGFKNVKQLSGGILKYLERYPNGEFNGECFIFDRRIALDGNLAPTQKYGLCVHCGDPSATSENCTRCGKVAPVCERCHAEPSKRSCSKNCAHHLELGSRVKPKKKSCANPESIKS